MQDHMAIMNLVGQVFGRLTVVAQAERRTKAIQWICVCACGVSVPYPIRSGNLRSGHTRSCGCLQKEATSLATRIHGHTATPKKTKVYRCWRHAMHRCYNKNDPAYKNYGGRGIKVCRRWHSFEHFLADVGPPPSPKHTLDRFPDNDGDYAPGNCRWTTYKSQNRNRRSNRLVTINEKTYCLIVWTEIYGQSYSTVEARLRRGWPAEAAITTPRYCKPSQPY